MASRFYLTTAIDYVNSRPHLGTAYEKITADVIARYARLAGVETHFVMGNDEHSQNVYRRAREQGLDPLEYCDRMEQIFREVWARLEVSFDDFIRTTQPRHRVAVQQMAQRCLDAGDVYQGWYEGWYCVSCEGFKQEKDLVDGNCPIHLTKPDWIKEKNYFFRLSAYRDRLLAHFAAHPDFLQPESRRNEILRLLEAGLEDISISRAGQSWGIPLPFDPDSVVYVWFDALINYAAAVGYGADEQLFTKWWPANLHIVGKDITRFHAVVWPAMLMSAGLPVPERIFAHGFVNFKGVRMSKTLGTIVDPLDAVERVGADPLRLYLTKEVPYGGDGDFSWERFELQHNSDLANNYGNLIARVTAMTERYRGGQLDPLPARSGRLAVVADEVGKAYRGAMERFALHEAVAVVFRLIDATNEFIAQEEPWKLAKDPGQAERLTQVLYDAAEATRLSAVLLSPVMPVTCAEILRRLGETTSASELSLERDGVWKGTFARRLFAGAPLWPRLAPLADAPLVDEGESVKATAQEREHQVSESEVTKTGEAVAAPVAAPAAPVAAVEGAPAAAVPVATPAVNPPAGERIPIDDFMKVDLRVAKVLAAERVPKSKKLLKLTVDVGFETRTVVAGIAEAYEPEALVGRTIAIVANLKPATLMGIESNGMVLAGSPEGGKPQLVTFETPLPPGSRVR
jgi:methionyl-tRNA synthetase